MSVAMSINSNSSVFETVKKNAAWFVTAAVVLVVSVIAFNKHFGMSKADRENECNYYYSQGLKERADVVYWADNGSKTLSDGAAKSARFYEDSYNKYCK